MSDKRTYSIGFDMTRERLTLTVNRPEGEIPFTVWRDVGRLAGVSIGTPECVVYEFRPNDTASLEKAERVLQGALFEKE